MKRRFAKPRNVNLDVVRTKDGTRIQPGDSLHTVPCPNNISKGMRQNLRRAVRGKAVNFDRQKCAYTVMVDEKISTRRVTSKRQQR